MTHSGLNILGNVGLRLKAIAESVLRGPCVPWQWLVQDCTAPARHLLEEVEIKIHLFIQLSECSYYVLCAKRAFENVE